ncbi:MAG TPA: 3'-5' exonuclease, partial [Fibrobacteraceae bacterium]|nr:3'-5' exonuclease [Fibrobacteraceae bacterium]
GIGKTTAEGLRNAAKKVGLGQWETLQQLVQIGDKVGTKLQAFHNMVLSWRQALEEKSPLPLLCEKILADTHYVTWLEEDDKDQAEERSANIGELVNALREFEEEHPEQGLEQFLQEVALLSDADKKVVEGQSRVTLMTVHMAKGLEFDQVFIAGCEEGIFPLIRRGVLSNQTPSEAKSQEEEERRLFYVGATRARKKLSLFSATQRFWQGTVQPFRESRFLEELDENVVERMDLGGGSSGSTRGPSWGGQSSGGNFAQRSFGSRQTHHGAFGGGYAQRSKTIRKVYPGGIPDPDAQSNTPVREVVYDEAPEEGLQAGAMVRHARFGLGLVRAVQGNGPDSRIDVEFQDGVVRKLVLKYANLSLVQRE